MADKKNVLKPDLWTPRPVEETIAVYAEWAATYDTDITARGYHTPKRIGQELASFSKPDAPILDFGCGTGFSGQVLRKLGFTTIDGTDVTAEMLAKATERGVYRKTWLSAPGELSFGRGAYKVIVAAGVVSLGAAPPETLGTLIAKLETGGLLALSYNDPTLKDASCLDALSVEIGNGRAEVIFREHGPHLDDVDMGSDVIVLRRR
jgi:predicted TPR repeat methyltransferase